jgi:hypothetical protein
LKSNNYIELLKFGLQEKKGKEKQTKLRTWNLKKKCKGTKLSGIKPIKCASKETKNTRN